MPRQIEYNHTLNPRPFQLLLAASKQIRQDIEQLAAHAPMPADAACLNLVLKGTADCTCRAVNLLGTPKPLAHALAKRFTITFTTCDDIFDRLEITDSLITLQRRLQAYPAWRALAQFGQLDYPPDAVEPALLGMELMLKFVAHAPRELAPSFVTSLVSTTPEQSWSVATFLDQYHYANVPKGELPPWFRRAKKIYAQFLKTFSQDPPPPPPPLTFEQRAAAQLAAHAAWPKFRVRAAVQDHTMLSPAQVKQLTTTEEQGGNRLSAEQQTILWLVGFTGINLEILPSLPLVQKLESGQVLGIELERGLLLRNFSGLAGDRSAGHSQDEEAAAANHHCIVPMPETVHKFLKQKASTVSSAATLEALLPSLSKISSRAAVFQYPCELKPSWARWARTTGPVLRQQGMDNLLVAVITGNFANTAKSKLYYCRIGAEEIWQACNTAYNCFGFGAPVARPDGIADFGTPAAPSVERVTRADGLLVAMVNALRPAPRASVSALVAFHNAYVRAVAYRLMFLLGLREARKFCLRANIDEAVDSTVNIDDKTTSGLEGGLPVVLCDEVRRLLSGYRAHCSALAGRLKRLTGETAAVKWLRAAGESQDVALLCKLTHHACSEIGTSDVLAAEFMLAPDFGRKVLENWLRQHGVRTRDIDRQMRHEVLGQESYTSTASHSIPAWAARLTPTLNRMAGALLSEKLFGLRISQ